MPLKTVKRVRKRIETVLDRNMNLQRNAFILRVYCLRRATRECLRRILYQHFFYEVKKLLGLGMNQWVTKNENIYIVLYSK